MGSMLRQSQVQDATSVQRCQETSRRTSRKGMQLERTWTSGGRITYLLARRFYDGHGAGCKRQAFDENVVLFRAINRTGQGCMLLVLLQILSKRYFLHGQQRMADLFA